MMRLISLLCGWLFLANCFAEKKQEIAQLAPLFEKAGVQGTFVLYRPETETFQIHNLARAETRYIPASTFKIINSIIGLEAGSVANVDEILPYGGGPQFLKSWENDMSLRDAIKISNVPIYRELARRTGLEKMQSWLTKLDYGNADTGKVVDRFWLDGPLKISAIEQTKFLSRLALKQLPIQQTTFDQVREITITERGPNWTLHSKTGWLQKPGSTEIGWWVGWVEDQGKIAAFALNIDLPNKEDGAKRIPLGRKCLAQLGVLPEEKLP